MGRAIMTKVGTRWAVGVLALGLWAGAAYAGGQQQSSKTSTHQRRHRAVKRSVGQTSTRAAGNANSSNSGQSSGAGTSGTHGTPQGGYPSLQNRQGTGNLNTLPNQTLTPGATTVPSNAGGSLLPATMPVPANTRPRKGRRLQPRQAAIRPKLRACLPSPHRLSPLMPICRAQ